MQVPNKVVVKCHIINVGKDGILLTLLTGSVSAFGVVMTEDGLLQNVATHNIKITNPKDIK